MAQDYLYGQGTYTFQSARTELLAQKSKQNYISGQLILEEKVRKYSKN